MSFREFVGLYWRKLRRSGAPWTAGAISDDSGLRIDVVQCYLDWAEKNSSLTDEDLSKKFESSVELKITPFGAVLVPLGTASNSTTKIGDMGVDEFWARMKVLLGK